MFAHAFEFHEDTLGDLVFPLATTYWIGTIPLIVGLVGLIFIRRIVYRVEKYEPQTVVEPKSNWLRTWVRWAGLAGEGPRWHRARLLLVFLFFAIFAVVGVLALIGEYNPYE